MKPKYYMGVAAFLGFLPSCFAISASNANPVPRPASFWSMDALSNGVLVDGMGLRSAIVPDLKGRVDAKTRETLPTFTPAIKAGVRGQALSLRAIEQGFLTIPEPKPLSFTEGMSVTVWIKIDTVATRMVILSCAEDIPTPKGGWVLSVSYGKVSFDAVDARGQTVSVRSAANSVPAKHWVHCGVVVDKENLSVYLNGTLAAKQPFAGPMTPATKPLVIGNHATIAAWRHQGCPAFDGLMDELNLWEKSLSATQMQAVCDEALPR